MPLSRIEQIGRNLKPGMNIRVSSIPAGDIDDTMAVIVQEILIGRDLPEIRAVVSDILTEKTGRQWSIPERDWAGEIAAIHGYVKDIYKDLYSEVRSRARYTRDTYKKELFQRGHNTLELRMGDCDDLTILLGSLYMTVGYGVILRIVGLGGNTYQHIYLLVGTPPEDPQEWIPVDPSRDEGPGWEITENVTIKKDYIVEEE